MGTGPKLDKEILIREKEIKRPRKCRKNITKNITIVLHSVALYVCLLRVRNEGSDKDDDDSYKV